MFPFDFVTRTFVSRRRKFMSSPLKNGPPRLRAEMRARGITQEELAAELQISQPQLANALAGRFGLFPASAARLLGPLREVA
jgi:hypothetical protein